MEKNFPKPAPAPAAPKPININGVNLSAEHPAYTVANGAVSLKPGWQNTLSSQDLDRMLQYGVLSPASAAEVRAYRSMAGRPQAAAAAGAANGPVYYTNIHAQQTAAPPVMSPTAATPPAAAPVQQAAAPVQQAAAPVQQAAARVAPEARQSQQISQTAAQQQQPRFAQGLKKEQMQTIQGVEAPYEGWANPQASGWETVKLLTDYGWKRLTPAQRGQILRWGAMGIIAKPYLDHIMGTD